eukprot:SAG31_NODE_43750_length_265_cov_1.813253_1_plen_21_part_01
MVLAYYGNRARMSTSDRCVLV